MPWKALDGEAVHTVLLLLNPYPQAHLTVLSRVAFLLRQEAFIKALRERADAETLRRLVASLEEGMEA